MNMLEALKLARDEGKRVRPLMWRIAAAFGNLTYVFFGDDIQHLVTFSNNADSPGMELNYQAEIFGEWEVVE